MIIKEIRNKNQFNIPFLNKFVNVVLVIIVYFKNYIVKLFFNIFFSEFSSFPSFWRWREASKNPNRLHLPWCWQSRWRIPASYHPPTGPIINNQVKRHINFYMKNKNKNTFNLRKIHLLQLFRNFTILKYFIHFIFCIFFLYYYPARNAGFKVCQFKLKSLYHQINIKIFYKYRIYCLGNFELIPQLCGICHIFDHIFPHLQILEFYVERYP